MVIAHRVHFCLQKLRLSGPTSQLAGGPRLRSKANTLGIHGPQARQQGAKPRPPGQLAGCIFTPKPIIHPERTQSCGTGSFMLKIPLISKFVTHKIYSLTEAKSHVGAQVYSRRGKPLGAAAPPRLVSEARAPPKG